MANFYLNVQNISRGNNRSVTKLTNYISGQTLYDSYNDTKYYRHRQDVRFCEIFLPANVPPTFGELQHLCDEIEGAEKRYDARTAREFKGSLPNELPFQDLVQIVSEYISYNFVERRLCAIAAIHEGRNVTTPSRNNPHAHIIVSTRTLGPNGFDKKKYREHNKRVYINVWREQWAVVQNRAYERNGLDIQVSHESLEVQGICDREPVNYLSLADWQREQRGEHTRAGDERRKIEARNKERACQQQLEQEHSLDIDRLP